jgi:hypothetical protein
VIVRFISNSRHGDWSKGDLGEATTQLAAQGENQKNVYLVRLIENGGKIVWATDEDFEPFNQLTLF